MLIIPLLWLVLSIVGGVSVTVLLKVVRLPYSTSKIGPTHPLIGGR